VAHLLPSAAPEPGATGTPLLEVRGLRTDIRLKRSTVHAVDGVDLTVRAGETLGLVGESGCGKTMTALSVIRLLPAGGEVVAGSIRLDGVDVLGLDEAELRQVRGNTVGMIFQDPLTSLNPSMTIGRQISEAVLLHRRVGRAAARRRTVEVLDLVGIAHASRRLHDYPHQFSGGMRQRVMIAIALACEPKLLIADEPTTALDVTIQAQILELMKDLKTNFNTAIILITHDLGVVAEMADHVAVMYAGHIVEEAEVTQLFDAPKHPYTQGLLASIPVLGQVKERLDVIPGSVPNLRNLPPGCRFANRCPHVMDICRKEDPALFLLPDKRTSRCWLYADEAVGVSSSSLSR
jgi:peptide/nickel transport system ATP-binding protein